MMMTSSEKVPIPRWITGVLIVMMGCTTVQPSPSSSTPASTTATSATLPVAPPPPRDVRSLPLSAYPWGPKTADGDRLDARYPEPKGFTRVKVAPGSFGEYLRSLPLEPEGAPVVDYRGNRLHQNGHHSNIAGVVAIDVGTRDLQHCADAIIRLHAEYRYGRGEHDLKYRTVSGKPLSYLGYVAGDRAVVQGNDIVLQRIAGPRKDDHAAMRVWLDDVFNWAGTASLERDAKKITRDDMQPGDFFVMSGSPFGHAVLILDMAKDEKGSLALLMGQSYMPAQSFQVLQPDAKSPWFIVEPGDIAVATPFWRPFPWSALRRM